MNNMSAAAKSELINHITARQGSTVLTDNIAVEDELRDLGLIGPGAGLTRKGSIARERLMRAAEDAAFA